MLHDIAPSLLSVFSVLFITLFCTCVAPDANAAPAPSQKTNAEKIAELKNQTALVEAETAALTAKKEKITAETDLSKARFGDVPTSGYKGEVEAKTGAGNAEALLLGSAALNKIAEKFAQQLKDDNPRITEGATLLIFETAKIPDFRALQYFNAMHEALSLQAKPATKGPVPGLDLESIEQDTRMPSLSSIGTLLQGAQNLLSFVKTDYTFSNVEIDAEETMLLHAVAGCFRKVCKGCRTSAISKINVELPDYYNPAAAVLPHAINAKLSDLYSWAKTSAEAKEWIKKLTTPDDKGNTLLAEVARQAAIQQKLESPNTYMVAVRLHKISGSSYTKKGFFSSLFTIPFSVMGGAVASYVAWEGMNGAVVSSMLLPWHGGYKSISEIQKIVNNE